MQSRFCVVVLARIYSDTSPPKKASFLPPPYVQFSKSMGDEVLPHLSIFKARHRSFSYNVDTSPYSGAQIGFRLSIHAHILFDQKLAKLKVTK